MQEATNMELLREYIRQGSEKAFARVVRRHVGLVYAAALRRTGNAGEAEEITQAVFIILARKANDLRPGTVLESWLYETTRLTACSFLRRERRRQAREQEAFLMQGTAEDVNDPQVWNQLAPLLDDAMARLGKKDRDAVVLRFFKEQNLREVAEALQMSEAAAQSRVHRAVEKLRKFLRSRGVILSAAMLTAAISAHAAPAAPSGVTEIAVAAVMAKGAAASSSTLTLIKGALKLMAWTKMKTVVVVGIGVLLAAGTTTTMMKKWQTSTLDHYLQDPGLDAISNAPPMVALQPTHFARKDPTAPQPAGTLLGRTVGLNAPDGTLYEKEIGRNIDLATAILKAYGPSFPSAHGPLSFARMIRPEELHHIRVDYLVTTDDQPAEKFKAEIARQFGWTGHVEMRDADVLLLQLNHTNAPGMKRTDGLSEADWEAKLPADKGIYRHNITVAKFAELVQGLFPKPVLDKTGLTENYDFVTGMFTGDEVEQAFHDRLGLDLTPGREPLEMLVVEKVK